MAKNQDRAVILTSGGINSVVAATRVLNLYDAHLLYLDYGHPAADAEKRAVRQIANAIAAKLHIVALPSVADLTKEEYTAENDDPESPARTQYEHPNRLAGTAMTLLGTAQQLAEAIRAVAIVSGASQCCNEEECGGIAHGQGEPQSRRIFYHAVQTVYELSMPPRRRIEFDYPFINMNRSDVVRAGLRAGAPFHLARSCHGSADDPCGHCSGCRSRQQAFQAAGIEDPALQHVG